ncbi:hypothetical protein PHYC_02894 [Phycisphaerales bacterium]|nr:hypothetical protein PHYC_02894 [Phycisphaerales bacterium]
MPETVLLQHDLPDGSSHFDWMIQRDDPRAGLITFRLQDRIDHPSCGGFDARRLPDHRAAYLTFEGPVAGGRGIVRRLATGRATAGETGGEMLVTADFGAGPRRWRGRCISGELWRFEEKTAETP